MRRKKTNTNEKLSAVTEKLSKNRLARDIDCPVLGSVGSNTTSSMMCTTPFFTCMFGRTTRIRFVPIST